MTDLAPLDSYFVCATPRTGSELLLGLLTSTGVAGRPESFFRAPDERIRAREWGLPETFGYGDLVNAAIEAGRTPNQVFAAKLMWGTTEHLVAKLRSVHPDAGGNDLDLLTRVFGRTRFIHIRREDVVAQAVSWVKAEQTATWWVDDNGPDHESGPGVEPHFDRRRIDQIVTMIGEHQDGWDQWFSANGIEPMRLTYEALVKDMTGTAQRVLDFLGLELADGAEIVPRNHKQADGLNDEWARRYIDGG